MIFTDPINADGVYPVNKGDPTRVSEGTVVIANPNVAHTYTVGFQDQEGNFVPYSNGVFTSDVHVRHGISALVSVQVSGITPGDDLRIGYAG